MPLSNSYESHQNSKAEEKVLLSMSKIKAALEGNKRQFIKRAG